MKATKLFIVLAVSAAITFAAIGVAYGYYVNSQSAINANGTYAPSTSDGGFWGWFRGCLGFGPNQTYGYQYQSPGNSTIEPPAYVPPQSPYQQYPNQGFYPNGFGRGCWGW